MGIFYDLKRSLLHRFLELAPTAKAADAVFAPPVAAAGTVGKEALITLTAGSESRTFAVDRADLATLFSGYDPVLKPLKVTTPAVMLHDVTQSLGDYFGLPLGVEDLVNTRLPKPYGTVHVKALPTSLRYRGQFDAHVIFTDLPQYPTPLHEFLFNDNSNENTGSAEIPLVLGYESVSTDPVLVRFPQTGVLGAGIGFDLGGSFTLDFVVSLASVTGDSVLFSTDPTAASLTTPAIGFRNGRPCIFNDTDFTVGGAWDKISTPIVANTPTRITLRCSAGTVMLAIDGVFQGNFTLTNQTAQLLGLGTADPAYNAWSTVVALGPIRYWPTGLSDSFLTALLGSSYNSLLPVHWWPFNGDYTNIGSSGLPWQAPMTFVDVAGKTMAASNSAAGAAFGAEFDCTKDFTLQFEYNASGTSSGWEGMFSTSNVAASVTGQLKFWNGALNIQGVNQLSNWALLQGGVTHTVTLMGVGGTIYLWVDGKTLDVQQVLAPASRLKLTHFGKAYQALSARHRIANLKFWDRAFTTRDELTAIVGATAGWSVQQYGGYNTTTGATAAVDGNTGTYFNNTYGPTVQTKVPDVVVGKKIWGLRYWFAKDTTNYKKKLKYIRVVYYNGTAWVAHETLTTKWCTTDANYPSYETLVFANPLVLTNTWIRIVGTTNYGDSYGYYWVSEYAVLYDGDAPA